MTLQPLVEPVPELTAEQRERYARHLPLPHFGEIGQRRLANACVLMVGAGGLGSPALQYLVAAGVRQIGIVDSDVVDLTNLQRQLIHSTAAIGELKAESAKRRLLEIDPLADITTYPYRLTEENIDEVFDGYDLILDGTDNLTTRYLISDAAVRLGKPVVWGAIQRWQAQISFFWTGERAVASGMPGPHGLSLRDVFPVQAPDGAVPATSEAGLLGTTPGVAGTMMAAEAIKVLTGSGEPLIGRILFVDLLAGTTAEIPIG